MDSYQIKLMQSLTTIPSAKRERKNHGSSHDITQLTFTCSKSTVETLKTV